MRNIVCVTLTILLLNSFAEAQFITGPKGGCYTISASGNKRYVDRSLCSGSTISDTRQQESNSRLTRSTSTNAQISAAAAAPSSSPFIRGPRGGCYTFSASGSKRYVDRSLCN
jgi:hypothetical protein